MIGEYDSKLTSLPAERDDATKKLSKMAPICPICSGTQAVSNCYNPLCGHANACEECFLKRPRHTDLDRKCGYHVDTSEVQHYDNWAAAGVVQEHTHRE